MELVNIYVDKLSSKINCQTAKKMSLWEMIGFKQNGLMIMLLRNIYFLPVLLNNKIPTDKNIYRCLFNV